MPDARARRRLLAAALAAAAAGATAPARAADDDPPTARERPAWITGPDGVRFRVRFDPGARLLLGAGVGVGAAAAVADFTAGPVGEVGLFLRSERPAPGWDVRWKRDHELAHLRLGPGGVDGVLYRGVYLRQSREGTLALPTTPPVAIALPFDIGLGTEVGRLDGPLAPAPGGAPLRVGVVRGDLLADLARAARPGCWLALALGARYDVGLARDGAGALQQDHQVTPMTALGFTARAVQRDGLLAGGVRAEAAYRWSSVRGWERAFRAEADAEATPLAINDRPVSLFAAARAEGGGGFPEPELRLVVGVRVSEPLR
jgi:hypothetical protein